MDMNFHWVGKIHCHWTNQSAPGEQTSLVYLGFDVDSQVPYQAFILFALYMESSYIVLL